MYKKWLFVLFASFALNAIHATSLRTENCPRLQEVRKWHFGSWTLLLVDNKKPTFNYLKFYQAMWSPSPYDDNRGKGECYYYFGPNQNDYFILVQENLPRPTAPAWRPIFTDSEICETSYPDNCVF